MPLYSLHSTKILFLVNITLKSELKLIQPTFMVWVKDLNLILEKLLESGPFFQEIVPNK